MLGNAPSRPTVMGHGFGLTPVPKIERSKFDRSHGHKTTFDGDYLIPILVDWIMPGDVINCSMNAFVRLNTLIKPYMDNAYFRTEAFFVPYRLIWPNFEKMCGAQANPGDSTSYTFPTIPMPAGGPEVGSLHDYFGLPTDQTNGYSVMSMMHRAYNLIYREWYRDQNLDNSPVVDTDDGPDTLADYVLLKRNKSHDYFTSCLPWPQKGTAVSLPVGAATAPVTLISHTVSTNAMLLKRSTDSTGMGASNLGSNATDELSKAADGTWEAVLDPNGRLQADLSSALATNVNQLRTAIQTQRMLELDAWGGTRYTEIIRRHFNVVNPDFRLQRPEYLGGGVSQINVHPVPQTSPTSGSNPQAQLAAFGTVNAVNHGFNHSFTEHGVLIMLASVTADLTYSQGLAREWSYSTRFDLPWPALCHLGEQSVLNKEIYNNLADGTAANQRNGVFGYIPRYEEARRKLSLVTGVFRPEYATPLDNEHLSQEFSAQPTLNAAFMKYDTPFDRVVAVPAEPHFRMDAFFRYICARPLPTYAVPMLGDRL